MKYLFYILFFFGMVTVIVSCQEPVKTSNTTNSLDTLFRLNKNPYVVMDQSPMDMIYLPADYPLKRMQLPIAQDIAAPVVRIIYSRPHKKGRKIFGADSTSLCAYGKEWRLGANEATEITFFRTVSINGKNIGPGTFTMFCIPNADSWEIIFNADTNIWGLNRNPTKDVFSLMIPAKVQEPSIEDFTMVLQETKEGGNLLMAWDNVKVDLPIVYMR